MKSLRELEADCGKWRAVSNNLMDLGTRAIDTSRLCTQVGWADEASAFAIMAAGIARMLEDTVLPVIEAHHAEHLAAHREVAALEAEMGEAS